MRLRLNPLSLIQAIKGHQRLTRSQVRRTSTRNQLLRLNKKLDFSNAAASKFNIVSFDGDFIVPFVSVHLTLHVVNVSQRRKIEMLAPDKRRQLAQKSFA